MYFYLLCMCETSNSIFSYTQLNFFSYDFFSTLNFSLTLQNKFLKTIEILIKILVSVKYFLVSQVVKHNQINGKSQPK